MNHMTVAVASKSKHAGWWKALRACGLPLSSSWVDWKFNTDESEGPSPDDWQRRWEANIADAAACDILLFLDLPGENQCGAIAEMGAALAHGRQVFLVSKSFWSIQHHRRCRKFSDFESAIAAIMAMRHGAQLRAAS